MDEKFAREVCHSQATEFLVANPVKCLEIDSNCLVMIVDGKLVPQHIEGNLRALSHFRSLMPQHLFADAA